MQETGTDALPRPIGMNKERPDACRIAAGVQNLILARLALVPAIQRPSPAPAAATDDLSPCLGDEVSFVGDKLRVRPEDMADGALDLRVRVIAMTQAAHREGDQGLQCGQIVGRGGAEGEHRRDEKGIELR